MTENGHTMRLRFLMLVIGGMWLVLWGHVAVIQGFRSSDLQDIRDRQRIRHVSIPARRGAILDRNGVPLAVNVETASYELRPGEIADPDDAAVQLARAAGKSVSAVRSLMRSDRDYAWLLRQADEDVAKRIDSLGLAGVRKFTDQRRYYPYGSLGAQVIGYCDVDGTGIEGCELYADRDLAGREGMTVMMLDALGREVPTLEEPALEAEHGEDIKLTIDWRIQEIVDEEISRCVEQFNADWGGAVVLNAETGEILAMSNIPEFDPNDTRALRNGDPAVRRNRIVTDMVEPGSTFKVVTFAEALESGVISEEDEIDCENGIYVVSGHKINDSHELGVVSAVETFTHSSNIAAVKIAEKIGKKHMYERARLLGFGTVSGIDVPDESKGLLDNPKHWSKLTLPTVSFGQGVAVSPIQLAMCYAAVANDGVLLRPHIVKSVYRDGGLKEDVVQKQVIRRAMRSKTAKRLEKLLVGVVESGTGKNAAVPNITIAGKTGTAQRVKDDGTGYELGRYIPSFVGYVVDRNPKIVCLVMIDSPRGQYYGSQVAAPVFASIVNRMLNIGQGPWSDAVRVAETGAPKRISLRMPDVRGDNAREAIANMKYLGLMPAVIGDTTYVTKQVPQAGTMIETGAAVTLFTNEMTVETNDKIEVPQLKGKTVREAVQHLVQSHLKVSVNGSGVVSRQDPPPGTLVDHGTVCMILCKKE